MKAWVICLIVISIVVMMEPVLSGGGKSLDPGLLDPCLRPNPPAGCHPPGSAGKPKERANEYKAGCTKGTRCAREG